MCSPHSDLHPLAADRFSEDPLARLEVKKGNVGVTVVVESNHRPRATASHSCRTNMMFKVWAPEFCGSPFQMCEKQLSSKEGERQNLFQGRDHLNGVVVYGMVRCVAQCVIQYSRRLCRKSRARFCSNVSL